MSVRKRTIALEIRQDRSHKSRFGSAMRTHLTHSLTKNSPLVVLRDIPIGNNSTYEGKVGWDARTAVGAPGGSRLLIALSGPSMSRKRKGSELGLSEIVSTTNN